MRNKINLIEDLKSKNPRALDYLVEQYSNLIFKIANGILNNRELSKECVNDVILKIWNNAQSFNKGEEKFNVWVMAIAKYTAIDILRKESKHYNMVSIEEMNIKEKQSLEENFINNDELSEVTNEIKNMNDLDKKIFLKKFYEEKTTKEISNDLGMEEKFINLRVFRGRKRLKEIFNYRRG